MKQKGYLPRVVDRLIDDSLGYSGGILIEGVRACGKTMTGRQHASSEVALDSGLPQIRAALEGWSGEDVAKIVIAYEPIWAIGTGETATSEDAQEVCGAIRKALAEDFGTETAEATRVLYGGSAKPGNIKELMAQPAVDGALVGGASLKADSFAAMAGFYA